MPSAPDCAPCSLVTNHLFPAPATAAHDQEPPAGGPASRQRMRLVAGSPRAATERAHPPPRPSAARRLFSPTSATSGADELDTLPVAPAVFRRGRGRSQAGPPFEVPATAGGVRAPGFLDQLRRELAEHAMAQSTRRNYAGHQAAWEQWCRAAGIDPATATADDVAYHLTWYLIALDETGEAVRDANGDPVASIATATLSLRLNAIDKAFETAGRDRPGRSLAVRTFMEGVRRLYGIAPTHAKQPVLLADLRRMVAVLHEHAVRHLQDLVVTRARRQTQATPGQLARLAWADVDLSGVDAYLLLAPDRRGGSRRRVRLRASSAEDRCPVVALRSLRQLSGGTGAVLTGPAGLPLTRQAVDKRLRALERAQDSDAEAAPVATTKSLRDAALVTCGWFAALRRSNIVALRWSDVTWHEGGDIRIRLRRSKTDQQAAGAWNWLPRLEGEVACPVAALTAWRDRLAELLGGDPRLVCPEAPVFPAMDRHDRLKTQEGSFRRLRGEAVNELVQDLAVRIGLATADREGASPVGGHSLRAGFVTQACMARLPLLEIAKVTHHADPRSLAAYHRPTDRASAATIRDMVASAAPGAAVGGRVPACPQHRTLPGSGAASAR